MLRVSIAGLSALLVACAGAADPAKCDLNQILKERHGEAWDDSPVWVDCDCNVDPRLAAVQESDPVSDATQAVKRRDTRFAAVMTYGLVVPGVESPRDIENHGYHILPDTTDNIRCYEHQRLQFAAADYALKYNQVLLEHLE